MTTSGAEREGISSYLADLPDGAHGLVVTKSVSFEETVKLCETVVGATRERLLVADAKGRADLQFEGSTREDLRALAQRATAEGHNGVFIVVRAASSIAHAGREGQVGTERALGATLVPGVRIVCVLDTEAVAQLTFTDGLALGRSHIVYAPDEAPR